VAVDLTQGPLARAALAPPALVAAPAVVVPASGSFTIPVPTAATSVLLSNESPNYLEITASGSSFWLGAWTADVMQLDGHTNFLQCGVQLVGSANAPSSSLVPTFAFSGDVIAGVYPSQLVRSVSSIITGSVTIAAGTVDATITGPVSIAAGQLVQVENAAGGSLLVGGDVSATFPSAQNITIDGQTISVETLQSAVHIALVNSLAPGTYNYVIPNAAACQALLLQVVAPNAVSAFIEGASTQFPYFRRVQIAAAPIFVSHEGNKFSGLIAPFYGAADASVNLEVLATTAGYVIQIYALYTAAPLYSEFFSTPFQRPNQPPVLPPAAGLAVAAGTDVQILAPVADVTVILFKAPFFFNGPGQGAMYAGIVGARRQTLLYGANSQISDYQALALLPGQGLYASEVGGASAIVCYYGINYSVS